MLAEREEGIARAVREQCSEARARVEVIEGLTEGMSPSLAGRCLTEIVALREYVEKVEGEYNDRFGPAEISL